MDTPFVEVRVNLTTVSTFEELVKTNSAVCGVWWCNGYGAYEGVVCVDICFPRLPPPPTFVDIYFVHNTSGRFDIDVVTHEQLHRVLDVLAGYQSILVAVDQIEYLLNIHAM